MDEAPRAMAARRAGVCALRPTPSARALRRRSISCCTPRRGLLTSISAAHGRGEGWGLRPRAEAGDRGRGLAAAGFGGACSTAKAQPERRRVGDDPSCGDAPPGARDRAPRLWGSCDAIRRRGGRSPCGDAGNPRPRPRAPRRRRGRDRDPVTPPGYQTGSRSDPFGRRGSRI